MDKHHSTNYNAVWSRPGLTLAGRGTFDLLDPGAGPERYRRAQELLASSGADIAFASFTFDPDEPGSVVLVPERVDPHFEAAPTLPGPGRVDEDDEERWPKMVSEALVAIERGEVEKVVLSRRIRVLFDHAPDPFAVAARLIASQSGSNVFALDNLVGASPELLLRINGGHVESIPLAGSATDQRPDLGTTKNSNEHELAADSVDAAFRSTGIRFRRFEPEIVQVGDLRHLGTRFEGTVPEGFGMADILPFLHPTAAVAGTPTATALDLIRDMEETSRGRYSGPVGWFDRSGQGEFAVALRCGLFHDDTALLHSGAGIVAGSTPDAELEETGWKLRPMLDALGMSAV